MSHGKVHDRDSHKGNKKKEQTTPKKTEPSVSVTICMREVRGRVKNTEAGLKHTSSSDKLHVHTRMTVIRERLEQALVLLTAPVVYIFDLHASIVPSGHIIRKARDSYLKVENKSGKEMKEKNESGDGGYVRADQIDLKSLDEQLQRHLTRAWTMEKNKKKKEEEEEVSGGRSNQTRQEWEIDPSKLIVKSVIARGTFGSVHRGIYDGQDVAVKLLDWGEEGHRSEAEIASLRAAFTQEVAVWHKLDHPNVTKFIGATMGSSDLHIQMENGHIGMPSNICCVVVEYCPGGALKSYLIKNRRKKLAFKVVVQLALDLARGLSYLHSQKIVHRDVKTENMLLDKTRTLKIADFGVARIEASNPHDMTGETGTLGYMAPEVLNGNPYNRKCDVYSFGICLWEIYCCDMPYPDLSFSEVTSAVVRQNLRPEIPRCCPSSLANVMKRCWDANPDRRLEMDEVVKMLEAIDTSKGGGMIPHDEPQGCLCFRRYRGP